MSTLNLTGERFGRLTAIKRAGTDGHYGMWVCRCDCGNEKIFSTVALTRGTATSCGCETGKRVPRMQIESDMVPEEDDSEVTESLLDCGWNHPDCFAIRKGTKCVALSSMRFPGRTDCPFYKSKKTGGGKV